MVTFGIKPTSAHTGYGYIKLGNALEAENAHEISVFVEKPNQETAEELIKQGDNLWNSGMFCFKASRYLSELTLHQPELVEQVRSVIANKQQDFDFLRLNQEDFEKCNSISIDYAVMENTKKGCVVSIDADWNDIGAWDAVWKISNKDNDNNVCRGDVITQDSQNSFLYSNDKLLVTIGIDDLMVIDTPDALLVADRTKAQDVKSVVERMKSEKRLEVERHMKIDRPWGQYNILHAEKMSEVKYVSLKPGAKISLQKHNHRSEHWVIIKGEAEVVIGEETFASCVGESVYIPVGVEHSLRNVGHGTLEVIEVRTGERIDEDDIVRIAS